MLNYKRIGLSVFLACVLLIQSACNTSAIVTVLQDAVQAATVALPVVATAAGIPPVVTTAVENYLVAANSGIEQSASILTSGQTPAQEATQITAIFAKVVAPQLPPGTPQSVVSAVQSVADSIAKMLAQMEVKKAAVGGAARKPWHPSGSDMAKLLQIRDTAQRNRERALAARPH